MFSWLCTEYEFSQDNGQCLERPVAGLLLQVSPSYLLVLLKASWTAWNPSALSSQALTSAAWQAEGSLTTGPRVMLSAKMRLLAPPPSWGAHKTGRERESKMPCTSQSYPEYNTTERRGTPYNKAVGRDVKVISVLQARDQAGRGIRKT